MISLIICLSMIGAPFQMHLIEPIIDLFFFFGDFFRLLTNCIWTCTKINKNIGSLHFLNIKIEYET